MDQWISFSYWRREEWKGHASKKAVRQAIRYDRGRGTLKLFELAESESGTSLEYGEVPRGEWDKVFAG
ncbi:hypothetical protein [Streptomyces sp. NPDC060001]|uniref:hypothetical protein n=1 Tax=Streptomyces sp. NPDC060001 TaxID=3347032 RepID=UPI00369C4515